MKPGQDERLRRYPLRSPSRYGIAAVIGVVGLILGVVLPIHGAYKLLFFTSYMVLILVSAALGGFGPGLVCTLLCAAGVAWWLEPQGSFAIDAPAEIFGVLVFVVAGVLVSGISERMHQAMRFERKARQLAEQTAEAERQAREAAQRAAEAVRDAQQAREEMLAVVAHDLRDPLAVIELNAKLIEHVAGADGQIQRRTMILHRTVQRMSRLIRDLMASTSIAAGKLSIDRSPESVEALLAETVEEHEPEAAAKSIALDYETAGELPRVPCDRDRVLQVLSNLVANAVRFTPPHGRVRIRAEARDGFVCVSVRDTGVGVSPGMLPFIFQPYSRERRTEGGRTGLGLSIAKAVVERHGGEMEVESKQGEGSTFTFTLPIAAPPAEPAAPRIERPFEANGARAHGG